MEEGSGAAALLAVSAAVSRPSGSPRSRPCVAVVPALGRTESKYFFSKMLLPLSISSPKDAVVFSPNIVQGILPDPLTNWNDPYQSHITISQVVITLLINAQ